MSFLTDLQCSCVLLSLCLAMIILSHGAVFEAGGERFLSDGTMRAIGGLHHLSQWVQLFLLR